MNTESPPPTNELRRVLHRWFVEYNPFYLVSATLCLAGLRMTSIGLSERGNLFGDLAVGAINEVYGLSLVGGAALLMRLGQRRPAVILALLAVLYQGDVVFQLEASSFLHGAGMVSAAMWIALFGFKMRVLARAMHLRLSRSAVALAALGGVGLALMPQIVSRMNVDAPREAVVALWLFALVALATHAPPRIASTVDLDAWGRTVLRRSVAGVWLLWGSLVALHVYFWSTTYPLGLGVLVPIAALLATRFVRGELRVWTMIGATLVITALAAPAGLALVSLLAAAALVLRAFRSPRAVVGDADRGSPEATPFRVAGADATPVTHRPRVTWVLAPASPAMQRRLLVGALSSLYLAVWTLHWHGGVWPAHNVALDLVAAVAVITHIARTRSYGTMLPMVASGLHFAWQIRIVDAPRNTLQWGLACTGTAFGVLVASLIVSYWVRERDDVALPRSREHGTVA